MLGTVFAHAKVVLQSQSNNDDDNDIQYLFIKY